MKKIKWVINNLLILGTKEQIVVAKSLIEEIVEQTLQSQQQVESSLAKREPRLPPKNVESESLNKLDSPRSERISPIPGYLMSTSKYFFSF